MSAPEPSTRSPGRVRRPLSPRGRRRFGEWLANRLMVAAGGIGALLVVPGLVGPRPLPWQANLAGIALLLLAAAAGVLVHYVSAERLGENAGLDGEG